MAVFSKVSKYFCFLEEIIRSSVKIWIFFATAKGMNFAVECDWNSKISQNIENFFFLKKDGVLERISWTFIKSIKIARLPQNRLNQ